MSTQQNNPNLSQLEDVAAMLENVDKTLAEYREIRRYRKILREERDNRLLNFKKKQKNIADILLPTESSLELSSRDEVQLLANELRLRNLQKLQKLKNVHSEAVEESIKFMVRIQEKLDVERKRIKALHKTLNSYFQRLLEMKQSLQEKGKPDNLRKRIDEAALTRKMEDYKKIRDLLEMEIIGLIELNNLKKAMKPNNLTLEQESGDELLDKIENEQLRESIPSPALPLPKEDKAKKAADEMKPGLEDEIKRESDKIAKEHGLAILWAIIKTPVVGFFTGIVAFFYKGIISPLIFGYDELKDAWNSIKSRKIRSIGNGVLKSLLILGSTAAVAYGLALGFIAVGVVALLANPFTLVGIGTILAVIVTVAIAAKILEKVFEAAKVIANKIFDREYEAFLPSQSLIKLKDKQAYKIAAFFRKEINEARAAMERAPHEKEKAIHREIVAILENTYKALNAIVIPDNVKANPAALLEARNKYKEIWEAGLKKINEKHQQLNHYYIEKHVLKMNDDLNVVIQQKSKKPEQKASAIKSMTLHNRQAIIHQLKVVQSQWDKLEAEHRAYVREMPEAAEPAAAPEAEVDRASKRSPKTPKPPNPFRDTKF